MQQRIDELDRQIIRATQAGLPLVSEPYAHIAQQLGIDAEQVMSRMQAMQNSGIIRRLGAIPNHYKLGYIFNGMTVWDVDDALIDTLGAQVGQLSFVSHCYQRPRCLPEWSYNLFAMVHGKTQAAVDVQILEIKALLGNHCRANTVLYSSKILKKTGLRLNPP